MLFWPPNRKLEASIELEDSLTPMPFSEVAKMSNKLLRIKGTNLQSAIAS